MSYFFLYINLLQKLKKKKNSFFVPAGLWFALRLSLLCVPELYMLSRHPRPAPAMSRSYGTASEAREKNTPSALSMCVKPKHAFVTLNSLYLSHTCHGVMQKEIKHRERMQIAESSQPSNPICAALFTRTVRCSSTTPPFCKTLSGTKLTLLTFIIINN